MRGHLLLTNCLEDELTRPNIELAPMVSNRLNDVTKQLTTIATVFLPLSFLTPGFFGQNLGWLVTHIGSLAAFLIFGIGTELLAVIILLVLFKRRGWMGKSS